MYRYLNILTQQYYETKYNENYITTHTKVNEKIQIIFNPKISLLLILIYFLKVNSLSLVGVDMCIK